MPRTFTADPQRQVDDKAELPDWVPERPHWLKNICPAVDVEKSRQWRLCAPDCSFPVPQEIFTRGCLYVMPPVHFFYKKNPNSSQIYFMSWAGLEAFWVKRVTTEDSSTLPGLSAPTWRDFLDGKYKYLGEKYLERPEDGELPSEPVAPADADVQVGRDVAMWHSCPDTAAQAREATLAANAAVKEAEARSALSGAMYAYYDSVSDDGDDDAEPAMWEVGAVRLFYTRDATANDKPLLSESERAQARPPNWENTKIEFFVEEDERKMVRASLARKKEVRFSRGWHKFDDYENIRQLFFMPKSRVAEEFPADGERIIQEDVLTWHRDSSDAKGREKPSRRIWPSLIATSVFRAEAKNRKLPLMVRMRAMLTYVNSQDLSSLIPLAQWQKAFLWT